MSPNDYLNDTQVLLSVVSFFFFCLLLAYFSTTEHNPEHALLIGYFTTLITCYYSVFDWAASNRRLHLILCSLPVYIMYVYNMYTYRFNDLDWAQIWFYLRRESLVWDLNKCVIADFMLINMRTQFRLWFVFWMHLLALHFMLWADKNLAEFCS